MKFLFTLSLAILLICSCRNHKKELLQEPELKTPSKTSNVSAKEIKSTKEISRIKVIQELETVYQQHKIDDDSIIAQTTTTRKKTLANKKVFKEKKIKKHKATPIKIKLAKIEFEEKIFDFGTLISGDKVYHKFKFKNTGDADLEIIVADASCGCTQPSFPFLPIAPGETGYIGVDYNSVSKVGLQKPEIEVYTNISKKPIILYLKGMVLYEEKEESIQDSSTLLSTAILDSLKIKTPQDTTSIKK